MYTLPTWKRIVDRMTRKTYQRRMFWTFFMTALAVLVFFGIIIGRFSYQMLEEEIYENAKKDLNTVVNSLEGFVEEIEKEALYVTLNQQYQEAISIDAEDMGYKNFQRVMGITNLLMYMTASQDVYDEINFYTVEGEYFSGNAEDDPEEYMEKKQVSAGELIDSEDLSRWISYSNLTGQGKTEVFLAFQRKVYSYGGKLMGVLEICVNRGQMKSYYGKNLQRYMNVFVVNKEEKIISSTDESALDQSLQNMPFGGLEADEIKKVDHIKYDGERYILLSHPYESMGWNIFATVQDKEIKKNTFKLVVILAVMEVVLILSVLVFIRFMTRKLTKPIQDMGQVVEEVSKGNCQVRIEEIQEGDMGALCNQINDMIVKLDRLMTNNIEIERQKRIFEINYIQMQMNPHFLYNTLETVCGMIEEEEKDRAIFVLNCLSKFYRRVLRSEAEQSGIESELLIVKEYLDIVKERFPDLFRYRIIVSEELKKQNCIKLILQPIVENAIVHGFQKRDNTFDLIIQGCVKGDTCVIEVVDNGCGIPPKKVQQLNESMINNDKDFDGFGIQNTDKRIKLHYGSKYGLSVQSEEGRWTIVKIILPRNEVS